MHQKVSVLLNFISETKPDRHVESAPPELKDRVFKWSGSDLGAVCGSTSSIIEQMCCQMTSVKWGQRLNPKISCLKSETVSRILQHVLEGKTIDQLH